MEMHPYNDLTACSEGCAIYQELQSETLQKGCQSSFRPQTRYLFLWALMALLARWLKLVIILSHTERISEGWFSHRYLSSGFSVNPLLNGSKNWRLLTFFFNKHKKERSWWKHSVYWAILPLPVASQKLNRKKKTESLIALRHISQIEWVHCLVGVKISVCKRQNQKNPVYLENCCQNTPIKKVWCLLSTRKKNVG